MALKMTAACDECHTKLAPTSSKASICSYEMTYCEECTERMAGAAPIATGNWFARPRRTKVVT
ncbi:MAG: DUF1272 domain-containing protein [Rhizomicrobium sp.]